MAIVYAATVLEHQRKIKQTVTLECRVKKKKKQFPIVLIFNARH